MSNYDITIAKSYSIFKTQPQLKRKRNSQENIYKNPHLTLNMLLHYLVKCRHLKLTEEVANDN